MTNRAPKVPRKGYVYLIKDHTRGLMKIGFTKDVAGRYCQIRTTNPGVELIYSFPGTTDTEDAIQQKFSERWVDGDWFILTDMQVQSIIEEYKSRNWRGGYYGSHVSQPDFKRIHRVLSKFNYQNPLIVSSLLSGQEGIWHHRV